MTRSDTTNEATAVQREVWRRLGPDGRTALAVQMSEQIRQVTLEGLRERHPAASHEELIGLLIELWHGPELASRSADAWRSS